MYGAAGEGVRSECAAGNCVVPWAPTTLANARRRGPTPFLWKACRGEMAVYVAVALPSQRASVCWGSTHPSPCYFSSARMRIYCSCASGHLQRRATRFGGSTVGSRDARTYR